MSKYTTQVRNVIENGYPIFPSDYSFYDPSHRVEFESLFTDHYYFNEIGFETVGLFRHQLKAHLNLIMPRYTMIFETTLSSYDPSVIKVYSESVKRRGSGTTQGESENNGLASGESTSFSATVPQSGLAGNGLEQYMRDADKGNSNSDTSSTGRSKQSGTSEDDMDREIYGSLSKSQVNQLQEIRDFYVNIDMEIIQSCRDLFMLIY